MLKDRVILIVIFFLIYFVTGCNGKVASDTPITEEPPSGKDNEPAEWVSVALEGVSFQFDVSLADSADMVFVPASELDSLLPYPEHLQFTFSMPEKTNHTFASGYLSFYAIDQFRQINSEAGEIIDTLMVMLAERSTETTDRELPFLPYLNAVQLFHSNARIISFQTGEGIRYVTQHVQDLSPILNDSLIYTFQGVTADNLYYVSLIMPVGHSGLANSWDEFFADIDYSDFGDNFETVRERDLTLLNSSSDADFEPALILLDQLVASILVDGPVLILE